MAMLAALLSSLDIIWISTLACQWDSAMAVSWMVICWTSHWTMVSSSLSVMKLSLASFSHTILWAMAVSSSGTNVVKLCWIVSNMLLVNLVSLDTIYGNRYSLVRFGRFLWFGSKFTILNLKLEYMF